MLRSLIEALELLAWSIKSHCLRPSASKWLWASNYPVVREMLTMESTELVLDRQMEPSSYHGVRIASKDDLRVALACGLHTSVDDRGLEQSNIMPQQHQWLPDTTVLLSGANYQI